MQQSGFGTFNFTAPNGWKSSPGVLGHFQLWMTGSSEGDRQIIMLVRGDRNMRLEDSQNLAGTRSMSQLKHQTITLCGSQPGDYFTGVGQGTSGTRHVNERVEGVTTTIGTSKYAVLYIRPATMSADVQAEAALHSICPKK